MYFPSLLFIQSYHYGVFYWSLILMLANSTYRSPLERFKGVNGVLNNCSDRASSSHISLSAQSRAALTCLCSLNRIFTGCLQCPRPCHICQLPVKTTGPSHVLLWNVCPSSCAYEVKFYTCRPSTELCYPSSWSGVPFQAAKLFLDPDFVIQCFGCPSFRHLKLW